MKTHNRAAIARPLPLDLKHFRAQRTRAERIWHKLEPHFYFWTPALVCCIIFAALLLTNYISWRV